MKKTILSSSLLAVFYCFGTMVSVAQEYKQYDLNSYYTPDIKRNSLDFDVSLSGYSNSAKYFYDPIDIFYGLQNLNTQNKTLSGNYSINYLGYKNTRSLIKTVYLSNSFDGNTSKSNREIPNSYQQTQKENNLGVSASTNYKFYNPNRQYLNLAFDGSFTNYNNKNLILVQEDTSSFRKDFKQTAMLHVALGIGTGRIENVTDARHAIYMLDALSKNNVLSKKLSDAEIFKLAQLISTVKNKRFFDSRLRLINEISQVDSFFTSNQLLNVTDARYFSNLYDMWLYGDVFQRQAGRTLDFNLESIFDRENTKFAQFKSVDTKQNINGMKYALSANYRYEKPLSQQWQLSAGSKLTALYYKQFYTDTYTETVHSNRANTYATYDFNCTLGYYPNTRTNFFVSAYDYGLYRFKFEGKSDEPITFIGDNYLENQAKFTTGVRYYISPQFSINGSIDWTRYNYFQYSGIDTDKQISSSLSFNVSCAYSLF